jgi:glycosyltransferase 2 family protein
VFVVTGTAEDGAGLIVKVYGRDAHDTQVLSTLWRTVWYREAGAPVSSRRLQQAEHEAFLTLLAAQAGVLTRSVVTAGASAADDVMLVLRDRGVTLEAEPGSWSPPSRRACGPRSAACTTPASRTANWTIFT